MSDDQKPHIIKYRTYFFILLALLGFTGLSILVTSVELGPVAVVAALVIASLKSTLVLTYFMHLKFDQRIYTVMVSLVLFVFTAFVVLTFLDYTFQ